MFLPQKKSCVRHCLLHYLKVFKSNEAVSVATLKHIKFHFTLFGIIENLCSGKRVEYRVSVINVLSFMPTVYAPPMRGAHIHINFC